MTTMTNTSMIHTDTTPGFLPFYCYTSLVLVSLFGGDLVLVKERLLATQSGVPPKYRC